MPPIVGSPAHAGICLALWPSEPTRRSLSSTRGDLPGRTSGGKTGRVALVPQHTLGSATATVRRTADLSHGLHRTRGDLPIKGSARAGKTVVPPHTRGSAFLEGCRPADSCGSPVHAGIYQIGRQIDLLGNRLSRTRGDLPHGITRRVPIGLPCTSVDLPDAATSRPSQFGFPRIRGDLPTSAFCLLLLVSLRSLPAHTRGSAIHCYFLVVDGLTRTCGDLPCESFARMAHYLPHTRGSAFPLAMRVHARRFTSYPHQRGSARMDQRTIIVALHTQGSAVAADLQRERDAGSPVHAGICPASRTIYLVLR